MTEVKPSMDGAAKLARAKHREIDIRYGKRRDRDRAFLAPFRIAEMNRFLADKYQGLLPDDDAGRDDARMMLDHLAMMSGNQLARMNAWLGSWAPWMPADEVTALITKVIAKPIKRKADTLGARLGLREADRTRLRITTIGSVDVTNAERAAARKARKRQSKQAMRRAKGKLTRSDYLAQSKENAKPWISEGISRRTWYRRQKLAE
jgi:hypothetical protein